MLLLPLLFCSLYCSCFLVFVPVFSACFVFVIFIVVAYQVIVPVVLFTVCILLTVCVVFILFIAVVYHVFVPVVFLTALDAFVFAFLIDVDGASAIILSFLLRFPLFLQLLLLLLLPNSRYFKMTQVFWLRQYFSVTLELRTGVHSSSWLNLSFTPPAGTPVHGGAAGIKWCCCWLW